MSDSRHLVLDSLVWRVVARKRNSDRACHIIVFDPLAMISQHSQIIVSSLHQRSYIGWQK